MPRATVNFNVKMTPAERETLGELAGDQPVAAYLRSLVNAERRNTFAPKVRGYCWADDHEDDNRLRKQTA